MKRDLSVPRCLGCHGESYEERSHLCERPPASLCSHYISGGARLPEGDGGCRKLRLGQSLLHDVPDQTGQQTRGGGHLLASTFVFTPALSFRPFLKCLQQRLMTWTCTSSMMSRTTLPKWRSMWWMGNRKLCLSTGKVPHERSPRTTHSSL